MPATGTTAFVTPEVMPITLVVVSTAGTRPRQTAGVTGDTSARKAAMRGDVLAARANRSASDRSQSAAAIAAHGLSAWRGAATVAAYVGFGQEPPTRQLLEGLRAGGTEILLPVIDDSTLDWAIYAGRTALSPGQLGILEPTGRRLGPAALARATVVVVPALAVDRMGHRLGRGQGYYDRALAEVRSPVVAVVYDEELIDAVPHEPHDRLVDAVLRPMGLTSISRK